MVSSVSTIAQYRTEEISSAIAAFNISIDHMIENLTSDEEKLNEITDYLFNLLERRSLFGASEYMALKVLNQVSCTIDDKLAWQLESYRAMKTGYIAPDFTFGEDVLAPGYGPADFPEKLSDLKSDYILVVFGASWCPQCTQELPEIARHYSRWESHGVEEVFVSLDEDTHSFRNFSGDFSFISICDYKEWNSPVAEAYFVFGVPMMYLLDSKREILLRPNSVKQMDAWVDWVLTPTPLAK